MTPVGTGSGGSEANVVELRTERLLLRDWRPQDRGPFARLNADPRVMEHFPSTLSREESDQLADRIEARLRHQGWGLWAVELLRDRQFAGFVGLNPVPFPAPFTPATEIGWRLAPEFWGEGYATEAAAAALDLAFDTLGLEEVVSYTSLPNLRSQGVMRRLGMSHDPADDFDHPRIPAGHRLCRQVLYRISPQSWRRERGRAAPP